MISQAFTFFYSPVEQFEVASLVIVTGPLLNDWVFGLTNFALYGIAVTVIVLGLHIVADNGHALVPSYWSVFVETVYASVSSFAADQLGVRNMLYFPFIYAIFWLLLVANLSSNVPYGYALGASVVIAIGLSVSIFIGVTIIGLVHHRLGFFAFFVPAGTPLGLVPLLVLIEIISYLARAFSLGIRHVANLAAGHILLAILASFLYPIAVSGLLIAVVSIAPIAIFVALIGLEIAVSIIQAYVFATLVSSYIHDAIELH